MIILNRIYENNDLPMIIKDMEFESFANGEILPNFEYTPPGLEEYLYNIVHFKNTVSNSVFFKPNTNMIINEHFSLYVCLADTTMVTYHGTEQYNKIEIKNGQAVILEPMVTHSFESDLLQYIEFIGVANDGE